MKTLISFDCEKDLNMKEVVARALAEFELCKTNITTGIDPKTGRDSQGRTENDMKADFIRGHCGEVYLMIYQGYTDDERDFQDVLEKDTHIPTAVKVTKPSEWHINFTKNNLKNIKLKQAWRQVPNKLIIFTNSYDREAPPDPSDTKYYLYQKYIWEDKDWKEVDWPKENKGLQ
jgi:hypothetical protein